MKNLQLILTKPCLQQWSDIEQPDGKHHCGKCEKNIVDLTTKSDTELLDFFKHKSDNVCGRLLASQMNRDLLLLPPAKIGWQWLMPLALAALAISPAEAQKTKPAVTQTEGQHKDANETKPSWASLPTLPITIKGTVVDQTNGKALASVKVRRMGEEDALAITDSLGRFELNLVDGDTLSKFIINLPGYSPIETYLNDNMVIKLIAEKRIMLGGISTISLNRSPLYLIRAGNKSCTIAASKLGELSPDWIESIEVLKDAKDTAVYGAKGANGVILIEIKKAYRKNIRFSK
ncbi:TonB-dependent outer membrane receptor, SusC/RagA subfamily, signature region [Pedobacter terrae]|uniref:TonB-dependent outer membrane receptor, SusC/RagA subfamily, signature region n=1 Tax=Pedobacter terrae TaxID=405671 RepID=A0A1G7XDL5_9SPHI|nr:hypothetical protein [Pedobacter terrae]SDG82375.1 TonB-dependent outer membrane receptor, SusC/RagA subfamily, signature region [Pedobacter terrae]